MYSTLDNGQQIAQIELNANAIALLSNFKSPVPIIGRTVSSVVGPLQRSTSAVRQGLWNVQHTKRGYALHFWNDLSECIDRTEEHELT